MDCIRVIGTSHPLERREERSLQHTSYDVSDLAARLPITAHAAPKQCGHPLVWILNVFTIHRSLHLLLHESFIIAAVVQALGRPRNLTVSPEVEDNGVKKIQAIVTF
jgi:hypothetical protein